MDDTVYLDYAATSAVRPDAVADAVADYLRNVGATPGRGGHRRAVEAGRIAFRCRRALAEILGVRGDPGRIAFQGGATHALNTALRGVLHPGDRVVRTAYDHNAVRRTVADLVRRNEVRETVVPGSPDGSVDLDAVERALRGGGEPARLLVVTHASNVLGTLLPVAEMAERARAVGALVLVDAAQTVGHVPVDVGALGADLLAFTGHKGLLGPQGTGGLWVREGVRVEPLMTGGTGSDSETAEMPLAMPDRLEAGTQNGPGIAGLLAGIELLLARGVARVHAGEAALKARLLRGLGEVEGVRVLSPPAPEGVAIVSLIVEGMDAAEAARRLDRDHGILVRGGLHCAPEAHGLLGTSGFGAVRVSPGWATTEGDVDRAVAALAAVAREARRETMVRGGG